MKHHSSLWPVSLWAAPTTLALGFLCLVANLPSAGAQCPLTCLAQTQMSLDPSGEGTFLPVNGLANIQANCLPLYTSQLFDANDQPIGNVVHCDRLEENLTFRITYTPNGNLCWGKVLIQDKLPPTLTCTGAVVPCNQPTGPEDAGTLSVTDNCDADPEILLTFESITPLDCNNPNQYIQQIERHWIAVDNSGNISPTCTQVIHVRRATFFDIVFPPDLTGNNALACDTADLDPAFTGSPLIFGSELDPPMCKILFTFMDDTVTFCPGTLTVTRTWTALDCCSGDILTQNQIIQVVDNEGPLIVCPADLTISTGENTCTAEVLLDSAQTSDACSPTIGQTVTTSWGGTGFGPYPAVKEGGYVIHYTATDACGNSATCSMNLTVKDLVPPKAFCRFPVNVYLDGQGVDTVTVEDVDAGSVDNCTMIMGQIKLMGEPDSLFRDSIPVDCSLIGVDTMVILRVADCWNNASMCMAPLHVLDTLPPLLICPSDTLLSCMVYQDYPEITEPATATDNCAFDSLFYVDAADLNPCHVGTITRTWTAVDAGGNIVQCTQILTLADTTAPVIIWPMDVTVGCGTPLDPANLGEPEVTDDCALLAVGHTDTIVPQPGCDILERTWRVKDWCSSYDSFYVQLIFLTDTIPPIIIDCPDDLTVFVDTSCTAKVTLDPLVVFDECGHVIFVDHDSPFADNPGEDASGTYPIGEWPITFTVSDACNETSCELVLSVRDNVPPILLCHPLETCIGADSMFLLDPLAMIDSLSDRCSEVTVTASPNMFDCADILKDIPITLTATDAQGNVTTCVDTLFLNNCDVCVKSIAGGGIQFSGKAIRWDNQPLADVPIEFRYGIHSDWTLTAVDGTYLSPILPPGVSLKVIAHPVVGDMNGLSTADVLAIAGHLIGWQPLSLADSWLAADVNRTGGISIADLVALRRAILHQSGGMKAGYWRLTPAQASVTGTPDTGLTPAFWGGYYHLQNIQSSVTDLDFRAVKSGDVDRTTSATGDQAEWSTARTFTVTAQGDPATPGAPLRLDIRCPEGDAMTGFQFTLGYDDRFLVFAGIETGALSNLSADQVLQTGPGRLRFSWDNVLDPVTTRGQTAFTLVFTMKSPMPAETLPVWLDGGDLSAEVYLQDGYRANLRLKGSRTDPEVDRPVDALWEAVPNPFRDRTVLPFDLAEDGPMEFAIIQPNGICLEVRRLVLPSGHHQIDLDPTILPGPGIYHCRMKTPRGTYYRSLVYMP